MQERDTLGNITLPQSVNESEVEDTTAGNKWEKAHIPKNATYRQQKKRTKTTYQESLL